MATAPTQAQAHGRCNRRATLRPRGKARILLPCSSPRSRPCHRKIPNPANSEKSCTKGLVDHIRGANPPPVLLRETVVGECLLDRRFHQLGGAAQTQAAQLLDHSDGLLACCRKVL